MSHEEDKIKHSKRLQKDTNAVKKQVKIALRGGTKAANIVPNKFAKRHAMDCGTPKCPLCGNPRRSAWNKDKRTTQEKKLFQDMDVNHYRHPSGIKDDE